jgi:cyclopropane fatty-acyl-phospholipid synthase-like methyltransferase
VLREKGHKPYASLEETPGGYDIITAFDLIEHLYAVPEFLKNCREKLSAKGRLVILTGNIGSFSAVMAGSHWWYAQYPEHIVFPSKKFFKENSGYGIERWILTYASKGYKFPLSRQWLGIQNTILRRQTFSGLPSIGPDHVLAVLKK